MPENHDKLIAALREQDRKQQKRHDELLDALRESQGGRDISRPRELLRRGIEEEQARREAEEGGQ